MRKITAEKCPAARLPTARFPVAKRRAQILPAGRIPMAKLCATKSPRTSGVRIEKHSLYNKWWSLHRSWRSIGRRSMYSTPYVCILYRLQCLCSPRAACAIRVVGSAVREPPLPFGNDLHRPWISLPHPRTASAICGWSSPSVEEAASYDNSLCHSWSRLRRPRAVFAIQE